MAIGHGREELVEAAAKQMKELAYASCFRQVHPKAIELAAKLVEITGGHFQHVYLGNVSDEKRSSTFCSNCSETLIQRNRYHIDLQQITPDGNCKKCNTPTYISL